MLVLSRSVDESIIIDLGTDQIRVMVCGVRGDTVRIGVDAPRKYPVWRNELHDLEKQDKGD